MERLGPGLVCSAGARRRKGATVIEDLWYKNAVIYCLDVERFLDADGDGVGDFAGLNRKLDYLAGLGVTCLWLQPFYRSPNRDNGYDVCDYYSVDPRFGTLGEFVEFMNHARQLGLRVILDLVVSHTSVEHPWFQSACTDPKSRYRDWYVWSDRRPKDHDTGMVFPPIQKTTWTREPRAGRYYYHRFYPFQPDLNTANPEVRREILRIMGFWLELGASGFRMDAVPFLIERKGAGVRPTKDYELLRTMRNFLQWRCRDAILLAEANVPPRESERYFGPHGDRLQMMLNFPVNQRLFYALATADARPLKQALLETREHPRATQWVNFLRSHDELDLGRLTERQRQRVFDALAPDSTMQLYGRGIRRRLAPMLNNDRARLENAYSLMLTLPGTPMLQFGDEIGLGDDLSLPERECARTPMQWSADRHGGFTSAKRPFLPVISDPIYGFQTVNVAAQQRDPNSLLRWIGETIRRRRECHEISWGDWDLLVPEAEDLLVMRYDWRDRRLLVLHNFSPEPRVVALSATEAGDPLLIDLLGRDDSRAKENGGHQISLPPYGYRWFRPGRVDGDLAHLDGEPKAPPPHAR
jgi:maltose alpha-D-glucosyltransferase / alpha-amylase